MEAVAFWLYADVLNAQADAIGTDKVLQVEIMDQRDKLWKQAKLKIYQNPVEGGEVAGLLGRFGEPTKQGEYYIKIEEILSEEDDD